MCLALIFQYSVGDAGNTPLHLAPRYLFFQYSVGDADPEDEAFRAMIISFQYSVGDAALVPTPADVCAYDKTVYFQYSVGDAHQGLVGAKRRACCSFNTPLEMLNIDNIEELLNHVITTFNTPLKMLIV